MRFSWTRAAKRDLADSATGEDADAGPPQEPEPPSIFDSYTSLAPTPQLAADIFADEWSSIFPPGCGVSGGRAPLFADDRITWAIGRLGGVDGRTVLELGPLEGAHTTMLEQAGATVTAVEANSRSFLKCLITKEIMGLQRSRFLRGDFVAYLERDRPTYDVVVASGVLYHLRDPLRLLELIAATSDTLVLWTHYYDAEVVGRSQYARQFTREPELVERGGRTYQLHPRDYLEALQWGGFSGGGAPSANWLSREDLLGYLTWLGYTDIDIEPLYEQRDHPNGPAITLVARRPAAP